MKKYKEKFCKWCDKSHKWYDRNGLKVETFMTVLSAIMLVYCVCSRDVGFSIFYAVATIINILTTFSMIKEKAFGKAVTRILDEELGKTYFHGFALRKYIETGAFLRFCRFQKDGFCYQLSSLMMIALRNEPTAKLCRGNVYCKNGEFKTVHSWVELKIPFNGWYVIDASWLFPCFIKKRQYAKYMKRKIEKKWECSHEDFWKLKFSEALHEATRSPETSMVLRELYAYGWPDDFAFREEVFSAESLFSGANGTFMPPFIGPQNMLVSTGILRDFVKNPARKRPKARTIRCAYSLLREYERYLAEQKEGV